MTLSFRFWSDPFVDFETSDDAGPLYRTVTSTNQHPNQTTIFSKHSLNNHEIYEYLGWKKIKQEQITTTSQKRSVSFLGWQQNEGQILTRSACRRTHFHWSWRTSKGFKTCERSLVLSRQLDIYIVFAYMYCVYSYIIYKCLSGYVVYKQIYIIDWYICISYTYILSLFFYRYVSTICFTGTKNEDSSCFAVFFLLMNCFETGWFDQTNQILTRCTCILLTSDILPEPLEM